MGDIVIIIFIFILGKNIWFECDIVFLFFFYKLLIKLKKCFMYENIFIFYVKNYFFNLKR